MHYWKVQHRFIKVCYKTKQHNQKKKKKQRIRNVKSAKQYIFKIFDCLEIHQTIQTALLA